MLFISQSIKPWVWMAGTREGLKPPKEVFSDNQDLHQDSQRHIPTYRNAASSSKKQQCTPKFPSIRFGRLAPFGISGWVGLFCVFLFVAADADAAAGSEHAAGRRKSETLDDA